MSEYLAIRKTRKYVGSYQHLDEWDTIGSFEVVGARKRPPAEDDEPDMCQPEVIDQWLKVESEAPRAKIKKALRHSLTSEGCAHEYDCCGCRSYTVGKVEHEGGRIWHVSISSSRNF